MSTSQNGGNSLLTQPFTTSTSNTDHVVVMPDPVPYLMPSSLPLNSVNSARSNLMTLNSATNPLGLIQYGDTNMNTQISTEPTVSGSYASSGVPFSYVTGDPMTFHQTDLPINLLTMDNVNGITETEDYQEKPDFTQFQSASQYQGSLKPPKRTMSAYAFYSRKVFQDVKKQMGGQPRQSDVFREIAKQWKEMSEEEKRPFIEEAKKDKQRKKNEEQHYIKLRKGIEKTIEMGAGSIHNLSMIQDNGKGVQALMAEHNYKQLALMFLSMNDSDIKSTVQILQEVSRLISSNQLPIDKEPDFSADLSLSDLQMVNQPGNLNQGYRCTFPGCNKVFNWKSNLNVHMRTHDKNRERKFVCPEENCGKSFYDNQHLKQHLVTHQRGQHMYTCPYQNCSKKYSTRGGLNLHIKSHHVIDKKYKCDIAGCDRAFVRKTDLNIHKLRVHSETKPYTCSFPGCNKSYVSQSEVNRHYQSHKITIDNQSTNLVI